MNWRHRIGISIIIMALIAGFPNYLWLLGVLPKPPEDLLEARWIYEGMAAVIGGCVGFVENPL